MIIARKYPEKSARVRAYTMIPKNRQYIRHACVSRGRVNEIVGGTRPGPTPTRKDDKRSLIISIGGHYLYYNLGARSHVASSHDSRNLVSVLTHTHTHTTCIQHDTCITYAPMYTRDTIYLDLTEYFPPPFSHCLRVKEKKRKKKENTIVILTYIRRKIRVKVDMRRKVSYWISVHVSTSFNVNALRQRFLATHISEWTQTHTHTHTHARTRLNHA